MPFDWRDYLKLARALVGQACLSAFTEAVQRTVVSRAYYAASASLEIMRRPASDSSGQVDLKIIEC